MNFITAVLVICVARLARGKLNKCPCTILVICTLANTYRSIELSVTLTNLCSIKIFVNLNMHRSLNIPEFTKKVKIILVSFYEFKICSYQSECEGESNEREKWDKMTPNNCPLPRRHVPPTVLSQPAKLAFDMHLPNIFYITYNII